MPASLSFDPEFAGVVEWGRLYRSLGLQVVPAFNPRAGEQWKRPSIRWREHENLQVSDETYEEWFRDYRGTNIGVICGACSGRVVVIDLDTQKELGAAEWWTALLDVHNNRMALETLCQRTGGGGLQLFFRWPDSHPLPSAHKTPIGVDIRGQGGFAVIAPSAHESGRRYAWVSGLGPADIDIETAPGWLCEAVDALLAKYGRVGTEAAAQPGSNVAVLPLEGTKTKTLGGEALDGREEIMTQFVWAAAADLRSVYDELPSADVIDRATTEAFERYVAKVAPRDRSAIDKKAALEREGRGLSLFREKMAYAMRQWNEKLLTASNRRLRDEFARRHQDAYGPHEAQASAVEHQTQADEFAVQPPRVFEVLDIPAIKALRDPRWLVEGMIIERSLTFLYGEPGAGKSFVVLSMALAVALGVGSWWFRPITASGAVLLISAEGLADLKFRIMAWEQASGQIADEAPFGLLHQTIDFLKEEDVVTLERTVESYLEDRDVELQLIIVDTVSRVLPGSDENLQKDMSVFIRACDRIRERFGCAVMGVHHSAKGAPKMRGSSVLQGAGDAVFAVVKPLEALSDNGEDGHAAQNSGPDEKQGILIAEKIKAARDGWAQRFSLREVHCGDIKGNTSLYANAVGSEEKAPSREPVKRNVDSKSNRQLTPEECAAVWDCINRAAARGEPFGKSNRKGDSERYFGVVIADVLSLPQRSVERIVNKWIDQPEPVVETYRMDRIKKGDQAGARGLRCRRPLGRLAENLDAYNAAHREEETG